MRKKLLILLCLCIIGGCTTTGTSARNSKKNTTEENILQLQEALEQKNIEIIKLNALIKEKDEKIEEIKKKLSTFGVFE